MSDIVGSFLQVFNWIVEQTKNRNSKVVKLWYNYNAIPVIVFHYGKYTVEYYTPTAFYSAKPYLVLISLKTTPPIYTYKDIVKHLDLNTLKYLKKYGADVDKYIKSKERINKLVGGGSMYVVYKGRRIPFGKYVIWDDVANRFLAFNDINALNEALRKYGYVKDHSAVKPGYYTEYGYFSNDILYDLYLKHRFPEVYSPTAQRIVEEHFELYNANPEEFRKKLLSIPKVKREIESSVKRTAVTTANERINQLMQEIEKLKQLVNQKPNYAPILEQLVKQYNSLVELLKMYGVKAPKPIVIQYVPSKQYKETITFESMIKAVTPIIQLLGLGFVVYMMFKILGSLRRAFA